MARPTKQGIDYFPIDVQFDDKIELLIADKGALAISVLLTTWQLIYQNEGYFIGNGRDLFLLIRRRIMLDVETIEDIINSAIERNIFDKTLHKKYRILTSKAIQKRYFIASQRKKIINVNKNYLLVEVNDIKNIRYIGVNVLNNATNVKEEVKEEVKNINVQNEFERLWILYGKKVGKKRAFKLWQKLSVKDKKEIFRVVPDYVKSKPDKQYRKDLATYLRNRAWEDEIIYQGGDDIPYYTTNLN